MYPRICIQESVRAGEPRPVLWSEIEAAMRDPRVQNICDQIKLLDGKDPDEMARLKSMLPVITPHTCRFRGDGKRKSANAVPSGLVMLDIDHIDDPLTSSSRVGYHARSHPRIKSTLWLLPQAVTAYA